MFLLKRFFRLMYLSLIEELIINYYNTHAKYHAQAKKVVQPIGSREAGGLSGPEVNSWYDAGSTVD
jgi:hypothetical protein